MSEQVMSKSASGLFKKILNNEATSGIIMIIAMVVAIICANTSAKEPVEQFLQTSIRFGIGSFESARSIEWWVNDVLMVFFFLQVGLELKGEMKEGSMSDAKTRLAPCLAALGGICCPAIIYAILNNGKGDMMNGWAIPTATDIAFAVCVLLLVSKNIPKSAKMFLLAVAIADDLGAVIIIALFYSQGVSMGMLGYACIFVFLLYLLNKAQVTNFLPYMILGVGLWICFHSGGIHTTIAGVVVAFTYPMHVQGEKESPLHILSKTVTPWVNYLILPFFAFASAGLELKGMTMETVKNTLTLGVGLGLFLGKQIGIFATTIALLKIKIASFPSTVTKMDIYGISVLGGIGFTMALFVGKLAFAGNELLQQEIRLGVIAGSVISALWAAIVFRYGRSMQKIFMKFCPKAK
ncbi:MAG: Na+/H+ antiporter NhaA [Alphaproteobacteria bacterium]|nr:Na+/H+ antiporter NhaA [Alphaproteobacteria bacterium]